MSFHLNLSWRFRFVHHWRLLIHSISDHKFTSFVNPKTSSLNSYWWRSNPRFLIFISNSILHSSCWTLAIHDRIIPTRVRKLKSLCIFKRFLSRIHYFRRVSYRYVVPYFILIRLLLDFLTNVWQPCCHQKFTEMLRMQRLVTSALCHSSICIMLWYVTHIRSTLWKGFVSFTYEWLVMRYSFFGKLFIAKFKGLFVSSHRWQLAHNISSIWGSALWDSIGHEIWNVASS